MLWCFICVWLSLVSLFGCWITEQNSWLGEARLAWVLVNSHKLPFLCCLLDEHLAQRCSVAATVTWEDFSGLALGFPDPGGRAALGLALWRRPRVGSMQGMACAGWDIMIGVSGWSGEDTASYSTSLPPSDKKALMRLPSCGKHPRNCSGEEEQVSVPIGHILAPWARCWWVSRQPWCLGICFLAALRQLGDTGSIVGCVYILWMQYYGHVLPCIRSSSLPFLLIKISNFKPCRSFLGLHAAGEEISPWHTFRNRMESGPEDQLRL